MNSPFQKSFYEELSKIPPSTTKKQLQWYFFLRVMILSIMLGISVILQTKSHFSFIPAITYTAYFIACIYLFTIISALALKFTQNFKNFALFQTVTDALIVGVIVYATGCSQSIFTILYFLPILAASFLLLRVGGLLLAAVSTMSYGYILMVELLYDPLPLINAASNLGELTVAMHFFAVHGVIFFLLGILSFIFFERMRRTESALSQTTLDYDRLEILYRQIFEDITSGIITIDDTSRITSFNRAAAKISGYDPSEVYGQDFHQFFPGFEQKASHGFRQMTELIKKDGTKIPTGFAWARLNMPGEYGNCRVYTIQDLSKIKDMQRQVKQAEKMATIGKMAAGIAHEFRNALAAISGSAQILQSEIAKNSANYRLINIITRESDRLDNIVSEFLLFSKPSVPVKQRFRLRTAVDETIEILEQGQKVSKKNCQIINNIPQDMEIWAESKQIKRIMQNLISNAYQSFGKLAGEIIVEAEVNRNEKSGNEESIITVSDNGPGIKEHDVPHIFEPFYTTRESGTGLGLAIVSQLVESHDGRISVITNPGEKTAFSITLPLP